MKKLAVAVLALAMLLALSCSGDDHTSQARIAFISERDGNSELYVMNADGSGLKRLTDTEGNESFPSWSPDGSQIAYVVENTGVPLHSYLVVDADGRGLREVATFNQLALSPLYDWSPDGTQIALELDDQAYVVNVDGSGVVQLAPGPRPAQSFAAKWSPDGSRIVFWGQNGADRALFFVNPDGSDLTRFSEDGSYVSWSPDGAKLGYLYSVPGSGIGSTIVMNPGGSERIDLGEILGMRLGRASRQFELGLSWSPDSARFAFSSADEGNLDLYTTASDGSELLKLTEGLGAGESRFDQIVWSPDGSKIALAVIIGQRFAPSEIYMVSTDGSGFENVTNTGNDMDVIIGWSADSSQVYYQAWHGEPIEGSERLNQLDADIFVMNADGSGVENLSDHPKSDTWAALWLPKAE